MFGYRRDELNGRSLHELLPGLDESVLLRDGRINPEVAFHCRCGMPFQVVDRVGRDAASPGKREDPRGPGGQEQRSHLRDDVL